jgi:hypothetical protein
MLSPPPRPVLAIDGPFRGHRLLIEDRVRARTLTFTVLGWKGHYLRQLDFLVWVREE